MKYCVFLLSFLLASCSVGPYKKADPEGFWGAEQQGYADVEIEPGVYVVEYYGDAGYGNPFPTVLEYALKRAAELCPNGFSHEIEKISMENAKIDSMRCNIRLCAGYPIASGVVRCK